MMFVPRSGAFRRVSALALIVLLFVSGSFATSALSQGIDWPALGAENLEWLGANKDAALLRVEGSSHYRVSVWDRKAGCRESNELHRAAESIRFDDHGIRIQLVDCEPEVVFSWSGIEWIEADRPGSLWLRIYMWEEDPFSLGFQTVDLVERFRIAMRLVARAKGADLEDPAAWYDF